VRPSAELPQLPHQNDGNEALSRNSGLAYRLGKLILQECHGNN
jgi:hypothetical protein